MGTSLVIGTLLADTYRVVRLVGAGGMGEVYEATHDRLAGRYAIKVLLAEVKDRENIFQRFRREAEVTSALRHPNIVQVVDFNVTLEGHPYLVMEYLEGVDVAAEILRVGAMPVARALDIVGQIASALAAAHSRKIVHRDLKPQNLFLVKLPGEEREVVKVVDFGISKVREATTKLTQEATVMGTPQYMAPEQAQGKLSRIDERTDEFALGTIAYELLTGRPAFEGEAVSAILYQVVHEAPEPMQKLAPMVGPDVESVVLKAMSKAQDDRYPTVLAFHRELLRAAEADHLVHTAVLSAPSEPTRGAEARTSSPVSTTTLDSAAKEGETDTSLVVGKRKGWVASGFAGAAVVTSAVFLLVTRKPEPAPPPLLAPPVTIAPAPPPVAKPPPAAKFATVEVERGPAGLQATVDGVAKELPITLPAGPETHTLVFKAPGYEPTELRVDGMRPHRSLVLNMKPVAAQAPTPTPEKPSAARASIPPSPRPVRKPTHAPPSPSPTPIAAPAPAAVAAPSKPPEKKAKLITDF